MTDFDKIITSTPVNAAAARLTGRGVNWEPAVTIIDWYADIPPMKGPGYYSEKRSNPEWVDFRGKTFGRLTILGVMDKHSGEGRPASWVCRCKCGSFCTRTSKSLKVADRNGNTFVPMCGRCDYQRRLGKGFAPSLKNQGPLKNAAGGGKAGVR